ncbi:MAG: PAS domain S-box protein [Heteroscytonema crispum UTEX LB 1556]
MSMSQDITQRKQAEIELQQSEETVRRQLAEIEAIYAYAPIGLCFVDTNLKFIRINEYLAEIDGMSVSEHIGRTLREVLPELGETLEPLYRQVIESGLPVENYEIRGTTPAQPGIQRDWLVSYYPLKGTDGAVLGVNVMVKEITETKRIEQALITSNNKLRGFFESNVVGTLFGDIYGNILDANDAFLQIVGYTREDLRAGRLRWIDITPPEYLYLDELAINEAKEKGACTAYEKEYIRKDGSRVTVLVGYSLHGEGREESVAFILDITAQKQATEAIRRSEQQLRRVIDSLFSFVGVMTPDGVLIEVNRTALDAAALRLEDVVGKCFPETYWWSYSTESQAQLQDAIERSRQGEIIRYDVQIRLSENRFIIIDFGLVPLFDAAGQVEYLIPSGIDISDRKQTEASLRESEQRTTLATNAASLGMWSWNPITDETIWTEKCKALFGLAADTEINYEVFLNTIHPQDRQWLQAAITRVIEGQEDYDLEYRVVWQDGSVHWIATKGKAFYNVSGQAIRLMGTSQDISDRKIAEAEREIMLLRSQEYTHRLQGLTTAALAINSANSIEEVLQVITQQARTIIGAHQSVTSTTIDENWAQAISAFSLSDKYAAWRDYKEKADGSGIYAYVCQTNRPVRMTQAELEAHPRWRGFGKEASKHPPMRGWLAAPLLGRNGRNIGLIQLSDKYEGEFTEEDSNILVQLAQMASIAIENTSLYEASVQARNQAEIANRVKDEFLAVLSHELRTPLNPILGWLKLLQNHKLDEAKKAQALTIIERNAKLQAELIEDLLDVSRILRGKITLNVCPVNLETVIKAALDTVNLSAEAKAINLRFSVLDFELGSTPEVKQIKNFQQNLWNSKSQISNPKFLVTGDASRLQQIIWNLLSNAIKFTPQGGHVEICLERIDSTAQITISDTGKGINPDFLPYIFDYFRQEDSTTTRKFGGLGLGLAIVRHLIELHGGTIQAESPGEGQGATFTVKLPLLETKRETTELLNNSPREIETNSINLAGLRVLVVDDETDSLDFVTFVLQQYHATVTAVSSAAQALGIIAHSKPDNIPDILVSDIGMPGMDGYTLVRIIRNWSPEQGGQIPAIALTAYAGDFDQQQALAAGFQMHISKPVEPDSLAAAIATLTLTR